MSNGINKVELNEFDTNNRFSLRLIDENDIGAPKMRNNFWMNKETYRTVLSLLFIFIFLSY